MSFMVYRAFLGFTEAGNFPAGIKTMAEWFPQKERAYATGIFNSGTNVGAIIAPVVVPWLAINYSWQIAFVVTGSIGFIWLIFWFMLYDVPSKHKKLSKAEYEYIHSDVSANPEDDREIINRKASWIELIKYKQAWCYILGKFFTDGIWWFMLFWTPAFLKAEYGLEGMQVSLPIAVVYTMAGVASIFGGWLPMWFVKNKGWNIVRARKTSMLLYACFPLMVIFSQAAGSYNMWYAIIIIGIAASAHQAWSANLYTTVSDMFPKYLVATVIGIGGMMGSIGGMAVAKFAGGLFDHYKALGHIQTGYYIMFIISGLAYLVAWFVMFKILVPNMPKVNL
jgi:ACS family hexuronate transporter-like MFS transporter